MMEKKKDWFPIVIFFGLLLLAIFSFAFGNDYYWHIKAGEYMVTNLKIPYYDIFSWYGISNHLYWFSHEWLSEVILYLYKIIFKDASAFIFCLSTYTLLIFLLYKFQKEKITKNIFFTIIWSLLGLLTFSRVLLPRPHMISYILLAITLYLLFDNYNNTNSSKIYFLPLISFLWANVHGGSSNLVYLLSILFFITGLFNLKFGKITNNRLTKNQLKKYLIVAVISFLVLAINPHGIKIWSYPYINMQDSSMINNIVEWASPSLNNFNDYSDFLVLGSIIITMILTKHKIKLIDFLVLGVFLVLGFKSIRFTPLLYITATFIIFNFIEPNKIGIKSWAIIPIFLSIIACSLTLSQKLIKNYHKKPISDNIINYIKKENPSRLFNYYDYGGYLIYNDIKVFIDGRADMYSKNIFSDAISLQNRGYKYLIDSYDFDMFVIPNNIALTIHLSVNENYSLVMSEDDVMVYKKN